MASDHSDSIFRFSFSSGHSDSGSRFSFSLLFECGSVQSPQSGNKRSIRQPRSSPALNPATSPLVINDNKNGILLTDTSAASLSAETRDLQHRVRTQYRRRLEQLADCQSLNCLLQSTKPNTNKVAQTDRESLEALEAATTLREMTRKIDRLNLDAHRSLSKLPDREQVLCPPPRLRHGRAYSGTSPHNTPSSPTTGGTNFDIHSLPSELPSDPTDSDLFRLDHRKLFPPDEVAHQPGDALVQDWLAERSRSEASASTKSHRSLFEEVIELTGEDVKAGVASEALIDLARSRREMDVAAPEEEKEDVADAGHSVDSWSEDDADHGLAREKDECEWLDLGPMVSAE